MKNFFTKIWGAIVANKIVSIVVASVLVVGISCAVVLPIALKHEHNFKGEFKVEENCHYQECECGEKKLAEHTLSELYIPDEAIHYKECTVCKTHLMVEDHHDSKLLSNETHHYKHCSVCDVDYNKVLHAFTIEEVSSETLKQSATQTSKAEYYKKCSCGYIDKSESAQTFESGLIITVLEITNDLSKVYDGASVLDILFNNNNPEKDVKIEYKLKDAEDSTYTEEKPVNVGEYVVRISVEASENYEAASVTKEFTISKAKSVIEVTNDLSKVYDGASVLDILFNNNNPEKDVKVEYKLKDAEDSTYTEEKPVNAGEYVVRLSVEESENYQAASITEEFTISKAESTITFKSDLSKVYDGTVLTTDLYEINQSEGEVVVDYAIAGSDVYFTDIPKDANDYVVRVKVLESQNYQAAESTKEVSISQYRLEFNHDVLAYVIDENGYLLTYLTGVNDEKLAMKFRAKVFDGEDIAITEKGVYEIADFLDTYIYYKEDTTFNEVTLNYELSESILNCLEDWQGFKLIIGELVEKTNVYVKSTSAEELDLTNVKVRINNQIIENALVSAVLNVTQNLNQTYVLEVKNAEFISYKGVNVELVDNANNVLATGKTITEKDAKPVSLRVVNSFTNPASLTVDIIGGILRVGDTITVKGKEGTITVQEIRMNGKTGTEAYIGDEPNFIYTYTTPERVLTKSVVSNDPTIILSTSAEIEKIEIEIYLKTAAEGGRTTPIFKDYRPILISCFDESTTVVLSDFYVINPNEGQESGARDFVYPGETTKATITFVNGIYIYDGMEILIRESSKTIAVGVLKITYKQNTST